MNHQSSARVVFPDFAVALSGVQDAIVKDTALTEDQLQAVCQGADHVRSDDAQLTRAVDCGHILIVQHEHAPWGRLNNLEDALLADRVPFDAHADGLRGFPPEYRYWRPEMDSPGVMSLTFDKRPYRIGA